jgi:hypothetical protein
VGELIQGSAGAYIFYVFNPRPIQISYLVGSTMPPKVAKGEYIETVSNPQSRSSLSRLSFDLTFPVFQWPALC